MNRSSLSSPAWLRKALAVLLAAAACTFVTGCGGGDKSSAPAHTVTQTPRHCGGSKVAAERRAQRRKLSRDLVALRRAAATVKGHTENGNAKLDVALDRFSLDVADETLSAHERSDYINRGAAIVAPKCFLCFQTLEAQRPIASGAKLPCD
ncbi:MAG: hypothetical protein ACJ74D_02750 [Gaiellaceae bacterium]